MVGTLVCFCMRLWLDLPDSISCRPHSIPGFFMDLFVANLSISFDTETVKSIKSWAISLAFRAHYLSICSLISRAGQVLHNFWLSRMKSVPAFSGLRDLAKFISFQGAIDWLWLTVPPVFQLFWAMLQCDWLKLEFLVVELLNSWYASNIFQGNYWGIRFESFSSTLIRPSTPYPPPPPPL